MSYIENLTGSVVNASVQESLALGAGNFKIKGFDLTTSGNYKVLSSGLAIIDGLRVISTGNLQILGSSALNKYIFLRIQTYTQIENGITVRKANLSLIAQTSSTPVNNTDLYTNITGTKDVLLGIVNGSGVLSTNIENVLLVYDTGWQPISMVTGYTYIGDGVRRIGNVVYFNINRFYKTDSTAIPNNTTIGNLPIEFSPSVTRMTNCVTLVGGTGYFQVSINGDITVGTVSGTYGFYVPVISYLM